VKLSDCWIEQLERSRSVATYKLAHRVLREAFKQQQRGDEVILTAAVTELPRSTRRRAMQDMVRLRLIRVEQEGNQAARVTELFFSDGKINRNKKGRDGQ
jgi:hypothetical protein